MERYFTRAEADEMLNTVRPLLEEIRSFRQEARAADQALVAQHWKARGNGHAGDDSEQDELTRVQRRREAVQTAIGERVDRIHALGIIVKDLDAGLVDFPSWRGGQVVYLCWKLDEPSVGWWHAIEAGFAGRTPLDE